jgi:hypothetical protein
MKATPEGLAKASTIVYGEVVAAKTTNDDMHMPIREKPNQKASDMKGARCPKCRELIDGADFIEAMEKTWHKECFTCAECSCKFAGGKFTAENGKPYCSKDWAKLFGDKVGSVTLSITLYSFLLAIRHHSLFGDKVGSVTLSITIYSCLRSFPFQPLTLYCFVLAIRHHSLFGDKVGSVILKSIFNKLNGVSRSS